MIQFWFSEDQFKYVNLACASLAVILLYLAPKTGWWPLLIFVLPWLLYFLFNKKIPLHRTPLDWFLLFFLITAVIGVWAAYNKDDALIKLWLISGAILFYYAVTACPGASPHSLMILVCCLAVVVSGHFLLTNNWNDTPASLAFVTNIAARWMMIRPTITSQVDPNAAEGVMVIALPIILAQGLTAIKQKKRLLLRISTTAGAFVVVGLLFSTSRGAWLALACGLSVGILLWGVKVGLYPRSSKKIILLLIGFVIISSVLFIIILSLKVNLEETFNILSSGGIGSSRVDMAFDTVDLIEDFPFTGGGLGAFSGLYSHYILVIPYHFSSHSHNMFLDVALEQGIGGLLTFGGLLLVSFSLLIFLPITSNGLLQLNSTSVLGGALFASLFAFVLHGLIDDPMYSSEGALFLFLVPGIIVTWYSYERELAKGYGDKWVLGFLGVSVLFMIITVIFYKPLTARWHANMGAVEMAKVELKDWPVIEWNDSRNVAHLSTAEKHFLQAITQDPSSRTANHRLGIIEMLRLDYVAAVPRLEMAYKIDSQHKGIRKSLGFSYVWTGNMDAAMAILDKVPEAAEELRVYVWWWGTKEREDLVGRAIMMLSEME